MADMRRLALPLCAALLARPAGAAEPPQQLPQQLPQLPSGQELERALAPPERARIPWLEGMAVRLWVQHNRTRGAGRDGTGARLVLDYARTWQLTPDWSARLSDQLDLLAGRAEPGPDRSHVRNNLREAWIGWRNARGPTQYYLDAGRINVRNGVGSGYNPTDFFKRDSVNRATVTLDPQALRENRLGTVMLRAQTIGDAGALTVGVAPRLADANPPGDPGSDTSLALARTNSREAAYVKWAPQLSQRLSLDVLGFVRAHERPRLGLNLSLLASDAVVVNAEWSGGRHQVLPGPGEDGDQWRWRGRGAVNVVWTTPLGLELTLERQHAGDALGREQWRRWRAVAAAPQLRQLGVLAQRRQLEQEPLVRDAWFARVSWPDAFKVRDLELAGFTLRNAYDGSALTQLAAERGFGERWRGGAFLVRYSGSRSSEFGSAPVRLQLAAYLEYRF
jgi:hypothetical protein